MFNVQLTTNEWTLLNGLHKASTLNLSPAAEGFQFILTLTCLFSNRKKNKLTCESSVLNN